MQNFCGIRNWHTVAVRRSSLAPACWGFVHPCIQRCVYKLFVQFTCLL